MTEVPYKVMTVHGHVISVRGFQVGRFMVRAKIEGELGLYGSPRMHEPSLAWRIDHVPSRSALAEVATFEEAFQIVDDLSRFAKKDPSSKKPERIKDQLGQELLAWLMYIFYNGYHCDFRTWRGEKVGEVQEEARA